MDVFHPDYDPVFFENLDDSPMDYYSRFSSENRHEYEDSYFDIPEDENENENENE